MSEAAAAPGLAPSPPPNVSPAHAAGYETVRKQAIFGGIPDDVIAHAVTVGAITVRELRRDVFVAAPGQGAGDGRILLIAHGQVALAVFDGGEATARIAEQDRYDSMSEEEREDLSLLPPPPLARIAKKNLATFIPGDLFNAAALPVGPDSSVAAYTLSPAHVIAMSPDMVGDLAAQYSAFEIRLRRAIELSQERLRNVNGVKQEILDFFIRQGISVSGPIVRVRQLDRCIDCKQCEEACESRYGSKRITLGGFQLGMLDFVYTCRTCEDPRCLDPCEYDSIKYDTEKREVIINEASCVGCTLCAQSCPYHAIEMVDVEDSQSPTFKKDFKIRLDKSGKLAFGPGKPRVARARRIANKCDHCHAYHDQACVAACPTGALIEVSARDLFRERSPAHIKSAKVGYADKPGRNRRELLPVQPFTEGLGVAGAGKAKVRRGRYGPLILWAIGLGVWALVLAEILLRLYVPEASVKYAFLRQSGLDPAVARLNVIDEGFNPGTQLAVWCGYIGSGLMLLSILYSPIRRIRGFRRIASNTMWFDFHMMAGIVGPMFIILHTALKLDNWVASAFWSMVIVVISGVVGRYLYTQVPDLLNGRELEELDNERRLARLRAEHPRAMQVVDAALDRHRQRAEAIARSAGGLRAFLWILGEDVRRPFARWRRRRLVRQLAVPKALKKELFYRLGRMALIHRRRVLVPRARLLLHTWKKVHVPFSVIMALISAVHIWFAFAYSM